MSDATLTVPTAFVDISQLAEGLADRVDEGRLMLYGPSSFDEGAWVRFAVLLADESAALEGVGRVVTSIDGGEERPDVARWDVVLDNLQLEGMGEVVYERILIARGSAFGDEHATGEVSLDDVEQIPESQAPPPPGTGDEFVDESTSVADSDEYHHHVAASATTDEYGDRTDDGGVTYGHEEYGQPMGFDEADETSVEGGEPDYGSGMAEASYAAPEEPAAMEAGFQDPGVAADADEAYGAPSWDYGGTAETHAPEIDAGEIEITDAPASAPPPAPPQQPGGFRIEPMGADGRTLARPSRGATWYPEVVPPPDPRPSSGLFSHTGGLPIPPHPPRPDIDPSMRIKPAPSPQNGVTAHEPLQYSPPVHAHDATDPAFAPPDHESGDFDSIDAQPLDDWQEEEP